ncbi:MAG: hypothetical protein WA418_20360 [Bradyrhizobium sp.]
MFEQKPSFVTFPGLDMNRSVPTRTHQMRQSSIIILIGLVALSLKRSRCLPCLRQDSGKATGHELTVQPRCHAARFTVDLVEPWEVRRQRFKDDRRIRRKAGFEHDSSVAAVTMQIAVLVLEVSSAAESFIGGRPLQRIIFGSPPCCAFAAEIVSSCARPITPPFSLPSSHVILRHNQLLGSLQFSCQ